ncbi:Diaminopimelate epimerase [Weeksella virosa]|nr:hypothetical protein [Weeksella virosa]SUP52103.1 Diaminopimelate epimerase [Weeksella virosa]
MKYTFYKYQGAGNDFVLLDDREETFLVDRQKIERICHRNFGVGADGLILLQNSNPYDFRMRYFNSDGKESSMCGNGGRCIAQFAFDLGLVQQEMTFEAIDGLHRAVVHPTYVALENDDVDKVEVYPSHYFLNTGITASCTICSRCAKDRCAKRKVRKYGTVRHILSRK